MSVVGSTLQRSNKILRFASLACAIVAAIAVGITAIIYVGEVIYRYGLNNPLNWSGDIGAYMLCIIVFLSVPLIARRRGHIAVTVILDTLPERVRIRINRILELSTASVLLVVAYFVFELCIRQYGQGVLTTMANQIPRWWLTALMTIGLILTALNFIAPADETAHDAAEI